MRGHGYTSDPPLPEVRTPRSLSPIHRGCVAEKRRRERKSKDREAREKENWAREKQGKSPIPTPDSTPEPESPSSAEGEVNYSVPPDPNTEGAIGRSLN